MASAHSHGTDMEDRAQRLFAEVPLEAVWAHLTRLKSVTLATKVVVRRAASAGKSLEDGQAVSKGAGVAYSIRNAADYFGVGNKAPLSQRVINDYHGALSLVFSEMMAAPTGPTRLEQIEAFVRNGHGLWNHERGGNFAAMALGPIQSGLYGRWLQGLGVDTGGWTSARPPLEGGLELGEGKTWATLEKLFARIPEIGDLYTDVFKCAPAWVTPAYDADNNDIDAPGVRGSMKETAILLIDDSGRMTQKDMRVFGGRFGEPKEIHGKPTYKSIYGITVEHPSSEYWWECLTIHQSPYITEALIAPVFGGVTQYRAICLAILYGLSAIVNYRPDLWWRIVEGDLDHVRALVEAFLDVIERVLPEQFLGSITGEEISFKQPGAILGNFPKSP